MQKNQPDLVRANTFILQRAFNRLRDMPDVLGSADPEELFPLVLKIRKYRDWWRDYSDLPARHKQNLIAHAIGLECEESITAPSPLLKHIINALQPLVDSPAWCAGVLSARSFWEAFLRHHLGNAKEAIRQASNSQTSSSTASKRISMLSYLCRDITTIWESNLQFIQWLGTAERHALYATNYSLFLPSDQRIHIGEPIEQMIVDSTRNPSLLYKLTPRDFERYVARIWEAFGFQVDLTSAAADGGVDIVCLSSHLEVPFKIAIQVKRYGRDRPVSVDMVRGFVGANAAIHANKLVYVTTSRYTKAAVDYVADPMLTGMLELRGMPDILRWAQQFERHCLSKNCEPRQQLSIAR